VPAAQALIDEAARSAGREPSEVRRIYNVVGTIGDVRSGSGLIGDVDTWVNELADYAVDLGFDTFIFWPRNEPVSQLKLFADEVVPRVRERVSDRRRGA
jgi:alkanesulfonate monooxygenase SsuD/methylene tetrahydromethanopterin reductase-like flavin-dependent oxidoreductase (luciferase family)